MKLNERGRHFGARLDQILAEIVESYFSGFAGADLNIVFPKKPGAYPT
jgi:hypothetical protein